MAAKFPLIQIITAIVICTIGGVTTAYADPAADAVHLSRAELMAKVAKASGGIAVSPLPTGPDATVLDVHREKSGEVELHKTKDDVIVAHAGHATILVGTEVEGAKETTPGEWRGGSMKEPRHFAMSPGDVMWIPAGLPHQIVLPPGSTFNYLAFKFDARSAP